VAKRILNCLRSTDVAGRLGNDEFAIFLPETDLPGAKLLAEKIRADIEEHVLVFIDPEKASTARIHATLSIGISCGRGSFLGVKGLTPDQLFSRATTACKKAKQQGGNRFLALEDTELKE
jgi:diguanylate cyclase (GGDEF)-like protein